MTVRWQYDLWVRRFWNRLGRPAKVALVLGVILAVASIPLPTLLALAVGLFAAGALGYSFPGEATRVGIYVALPILTVAFIAGFVRGFSATVLVVFLACSLVLPVTLARLGAGARVGRTTAR